MKILYYNWVDYLDDERRGGGVTIYQKNLIDGLALETETEAWFLSSGISYDLFSSEPRWTQVRHGSVTNRSRRFEIVNSGTLSPSHHSFGNPAQVSHPKTVAAFFDFIEKNGPFDVIHFHNLEGIPAEVLSLKSRWPETRLVLSLHNYYPFCPQVNLWYKEKAHCADFREGRKCGNCLLHRHDERIVRQANAVAFRLKSAGLRPGGWFFRRGFLPALRVAKRLVRAYGALRRRPVYEAIEADTQDLPGKPGALRPLGGDPSRFAARRAEMVQLINAHCDLVLGVSDRVTQIAQGFGIRPEILKTSYIGTQQADKYAETSPRPTLPREDGTLTLGYLGYMRADKGFFFLLDALEALDPALQARIHLVVAAPRGSHQAMEQFEDLAEHFASVSYANGYTHDSLDDILKDVDVGLVPVLWEDNLPQVAIEMHARHIPLLTADKGGAQELGNAADMVFTAGDEEDFAARVQAILEGQVDLGAYWAGAMAPRSMEAHLSELKSLYQGA